jgi:hypothetical protein
LPWPGLVYDNVGDPNSNPNLSFTVKFNVNSKMNVNSTKAPNL